MEITDEHLAIIREALADYRRWFDGNGESDVDYRKQIDEVLKAMRTKN